jgi:hypothetical protein
MPLHRLPALGLLILSGLLVAVAPALARQAVITSSAPYTVALPVVDTSEAQRDQAFVNALTQVLVRVAGGQDLRDKPGYAEALKGAPGLVQQYQYQRAGHGLSLQVSFDPAAVQRLVAQIGVTPAGAKPPVLVMVRGADGHLLDKDALDPLARAVAAHGGSVVLADPADATDPSRLAAADPATLAALSRQYHTGLILLGNLQGAQADWTLLSGGQPQHWSGQSTTRSALLADAGNALTERLGRQLNVIGGSVGEARLWVEGLDSAADYVNLVALLRADPSVRQVTTLAASDAGMLLSVKTGMPPPAFAASLAAGGRLIQSGAHEGADASLRWLH